ncbi:Cap-specific mRNA (nucleoside-2'-O-)-methyltransferase [Colletotrichum shisoi]|uniref:Cap-specific mRNA (Nucleoside-2'-O-)-methyltransferase n=1 Tax=Colletotrichum shisoi TaxID=2078593 RepID=A0A5Q4BSY4_9PEZI|nr:Cap-specific mRNA (nucleoside-2'-O-)-methyltransferase [Colletotrichum shisoi]
MATNSITPVHDNFAEDALSSTDQRTRQASGAIVQFLMERVPEFRELQKIRQQGWENPQGDAFFRQQRNQADKANARTAQFFYQMMQRIGQELHQAVGAFAIQNKSLSQPIVLDMCMAPGGFLATALRLNPNARAVGFSLPVESGGHKILMPESRRVELRFLDITMLAADMGVTEVPVDHPDHGKFLPQQLKPDDLFDLVICDGQVLRTHSREEYRERREARRLTVTQLYLGLKHMRPGGTMVVLLHKLEAWDTVLLLRTVREFATVKVFKPRTSHSKRSSFYMVARNVQSQRTAAVHAIGGWKSIWKAATFGTDEEYQKTLHEGQPSVEEVLSEFGPELIRLGKDVWATQAKALAEAPFIKQQS